MAVIGLDVGTTGCKATVLAQDGSVLDYAYESYDLIMVGRGMAELDPRVVWESVKKVLRKAAAGKEITAISVASMGESFVCLDAYDNPLGGSMLYSDVRGTKETEQIRAAFDEKELLSITGMPMNPMFTLCKLLWVSQNTDQYSKAKYLMLFEDYIGYMLTGQRAIDYSLASRTMLLDIKKKEWASGIADRFGLDTGKFSTPVLAGTEIGCLRKEVAAELGMSEKTKFYAGAHDQACAALGSGVLEEGDCVDGMGTSECITTIIRSDSDPDLMLKNNFCMEPYVKEGTYINLAFNTSAGASVNWYRKVIERERLQDAKATGKDIYAIMEAECPSEPTSLLFLPYLAGTGTPYMDTMANGAWLGMKLETTKGDLYKSCLEGICFEILLNANLVAETGTNIQNMKCVGGLSNSDMLMQMKADIMGQAVTRLKVKESGTLALAMLCYVAEGAYRDYAQAAEAMVKIDRTFEPDLRKHAIYAEKYESYKRIYHALKTII